MACAPSEDSGQPGHPPSLIRVFAVCMKKAWVLSYPLSAQRRLWSAWADLSLRWAHSHFVGFVTRQLTLSKTRGKPSCFCNDILLAGARLLSLGSMAEISQVYCLGTCLTLSSEFELLLRESVLTQLHSGQTMMYQFWVNANICSAHDVFIFSFSSFYHLLLLHSTAVKQTFRKRLWCFIKMKCPLKSMLLFSLNNSDLK